jgi:PAS domain S-box-containing protein
VDVKMNFNHKILFIVENTTDSYLNNMLDSLKYEYTIVSLKNFYKFLEGDQKHFDLFLMDLDLENPENLNFINDVHIELPDCAILILDQELSIDGALKALEYGAQECLAKEQLNTEILKHSIEQAVKRKDIYLESQLITEQLVDLKYMDGKYKNFLNIIGVDVTDHIKAEEVFKQKHNFLQQLIDIIPYPLFFKDKNYIYRFCNKSFEEFIGLSRDEIIGKTVYDIAPKDLADQYHYMDKKLVQEGTLQVYEAPVQYADGSRRTVIFNKSVFNDLDGKLAGLTGVMVDITQRKKAEESLHESEKQLNDILNHLPDATFAINCEGMVIFWNKALEDMLHVKSDDMIGKVNYEYSIPFYGDRRPILIDLILKTDDEFLNSQYYNIKRDKHAIMAETTISNFFGNEDMVLWGKASPLYDEEGNLMGAIESIRDITEMRKAEIELQKYHENLEEQVEERTEELEKTNEKLKSVIAKHEKAEIKMSELVVELKRSNKDLEQFAYVASHDLQEPLRMVSSFTQLLERKYRDKLDEDANEYIWYVVDGAKRMQSLINDLLSYSRVTTKVKDFAKINLNETVDEALFNLEIAIEENDTIVVVDSLPQIHGDSSQMVQLFQNIIGNAIKYRSEKIPEIHISASEGDQEWIFKIEDNGIGIQPEYNERIFQIFQRLHGSDAYSGTGIGLAICKKIVELHGGSIWVNSKPGEGSIFYFTIPK